MNNLIEKISSYNLFNYLFPGILFSVLLKILTGYSVNFDGNYILQGITYYFIGLVISLVGSLIIAKPLKRAKFIVLKDYKEFLKASKKDPKLELLSEISNMYRTIAASFFLLLLALWYKCLLWGYPGLNIKNHPVIAIVLFLLLFLCAHRKQNNFITKRIEANELYE